MMESQTPIRVLIVADDPLARAGLVGMVTMTQYCEVAGQVAGGEDLPIEVYQPDLILWDTGWDAEEQDLPAQEGIPILALVAESHSAAALWAGGVRGMLPRDASIEQLDAAVLGLTSGLVMLADPFAEALLPTPSLEALLPPLEDLTPRENDVLQLLAEGLANKAIARRLDISEHTVKFHVNAIMSKLGASSRTQAVVRATRAGLIVL